MSTKLLLQEPVYDPAEFPEPVALRDLTWEKLSAASNYFLRVRCGEEAPAILAPLVILAERSGIPSSRTKKSIAVILRSMVRRRETFWQWDQETWKSLLSARLDSRPYVAAVAYHFGRLREPAMFGNAGIYAEAIFGSAVSHEQLDRLRRVLQSLGYAQAPLHRVLPSLLDERTGKRVRFLFPFRGRKAGSSVLNGTIIPLLCAKAGLPRRDSRGMITNHRDGLRRSLRWQAFQS